MFRIDRSVIHASVAAAILFVAPAAIAANCGDTTGGGGTDVPCSCGDTVTTDTILDGNVDPVVSLANADVCAGSGLFVDSGIELDLDGATLRGDGSGFGIVLFAGSVRDGEVSGFEYGIFSVADDGVVHSIRARDNAEIGIILVDCARCVVERSKAIGNGFLGIYLFSTSDAVLLKNLARGNGHGIGDASGSGNTLASNRSEGNELAGFVVQTPDSVLLRNSSKQNGTEGFSLASDRLHVERNVADSNEGTGFEILGADDGEYIRNTSRRNGGNGLDALPGPAGSSTGNEFFRNYAGDNGGDGIIVLGANEDLGRNQGRRNGGGVQCEIDGVECAD